MQETGRNEFDELAKSAAAAREIGKNEVALNYYQRALQIRPEWEEGWWYVGTLLYDANHYREAIPALEKVVHLDSGLAPGWNFLGLCEFEIHDYGNALGHLKKSQELGFGDDPEVARIAKYHLALLLIRNSQFEDASLLLREAFGDQQPTEAKIALGLSLLRVPLLPEEVDPSKDALVRAAGETAAITVLGDSGRSLESFRKLLKEYPTTPNLHYAFGIVLASAGLADEALVNQRNEVEISPEHFLAYTKISSLELRRKRPQEALRAAETAVRLSPHSPAPHRLLAGILESLGKREKAAAELRQAENLASEKPAPDARILSMYSAGSALTERTDSAKVPSEQEPQNLADFDHRAAASQSAGHPGEAIQIYQEALRSHPGWEDGWWNLAMLSYAQKQYPEAIKDLKIFLTLKPGNGTAWAVLGLSEFEVKDYSNAFIHLQRGQLLGFGGSVESVQLARHRLAALFNRNGEFDRATDLLAAEANSGTRSQPIHFVLGMALLRIRSLPDAVESSKKNLVQAAGEIGSLLQNSRYDEAFSKFEILLQQYPSTPFLHYAYATALATFSRFDEAESRLRQELSISPASDFVYAKMASIELKTRRPESALPSAQRAVELAPGSPEAHYLLGRSWLELGQPQKAVEELEAAEKLSPGSPQVHFNLAKAYARADLPVKAEQERLTFARLNALAEDQRGRHGGQSYSGSQESSEFAAPDNSAIRTTMPPPVVNLWNEFH